MNPGLIQGIGTNVAPVSTIKAASSQGNGNWPSFFTPDKTLFQRNPYTPKVGDYSTYKGDWQGYLNDLAKSGDIVAMDRLLNYLMTEESLQKGRDWTAQREDSQYQRLVKDLRAAGLNPYYILTHAGGQPGVSASQGASYSGSYGIQYNKNQMYYELGQGALKNQRMSIILNFIGQVLGSVSSFARIAMK